ncbi:MAG: S46 family peptidase [Planctomycetota bacterium]|nr:S46 family peptidase [Planctomycetota bacterium]
MIKPLRLALLAGFLLPLSASAEEGMWLLTAPPTQRLAQVHNFSPSAEWLLEMQRAAVNVDGASGSFVSSSGLIMTNHHVASTWIQELSSAEHDYIKNGFHARTRQEELPIPGAEVSVLWDIEDVTEKIKAAGKGKSPEEANSAILRAIAELESAEKQRSGMHARVVTLYGGGVYHLHRVKRYTDVRLVFAPEIQAAFFGGDTDNFEYPRFCFDVAFVRAYENGAPVQSENFLRWSTQGSQENDLVFVFGHPGSTERLLTIADVEHRRDVAIPTRLEWYWRTENKLTAFANRSAENRRIASDDIFGVANGRKAFTGMYHGLLDPALMGAKRDEEAKLRAAIKADPALAARVGDALDRLESAVEDAARTHERDWAISRAFRLSRLVQHADTLVSLASEWPRPNADRLREFRDAAMPGVIADLEATTPVYPQYETFLIADGLAYLAQHLGGDDPLVRSLLDGKSPEDRAAELVGASKLGDASHRAALVKAGPSGLAKALKDSDEPLLAFARTLDPVLREITARRESGLEAVSRDVYARLADARFAAFGKTTYPDATGTLRLSYGTVKSYPEGGGTVPAYTTMGGLFERAAARDESEFDLPDSWTKAKDALNLGTPFNFVCTADIIGGNSGSPVVNREGRVVGLIFDGNIQSLPLAFQYSDKQARAVAVDSRALVEGLRVVYKADALVRELTAGD